MRHRCRVVLFLFLAAFAAGSAFAQTTGDLDGTVTDQNGGPLPGASVELKSPNLQGARTAVTDSAGRYRFPALAPGVYAVTAKLAGLRVGRAHGPEGFARRHDDGGPAARRLREGEPRRHGGGARDRHDADDDRDERDARDDAAPADRAELRLDREHGLRDRDGRDGQHHDLRSDRPRERVHHRRRQHDGRQDGHAGQVAQQRVRPGGRGQDRRLRGRVRPRPRRDDQRRHEIRRQRVPRGRVRVLRRVVPRRERQAHGGSHRGEPGAVLHARRASTSARTSAATS